MRKENFFTGEPVPDGSPPFEQMCSEQEAINNASFGKALYDPGYNGTTQSPTIINPGGYGYNELYQRLTNGNTNANTGYGYNMAYQQPQSYYYNYGYPQQQYYYQQPVANNWYQYNNGYQGYPQSPYPYSYGTGLGYGGQQAAFQVQSPYQQRPSNTYFIQPVNFGGEYLPPTGYEDQIDTLMRQYWTKEQDAYAEDIARRSMYNNSGFFGGPNYYGSPYFVNSGAQQINAEISNVVRDMRDQARENRLTLSMQLSKVAHKFANEPIEDDELHDRYYGKTVVNPQSFWGTAEQFMEQYRFEQMIPYDNSDFYAQRRAEVSRQFHQMVPENANMEEFLRSAGMFMRSCEAEEEMHRRRNGKMYYNSEDNVYKHFVRLKAMERYGKEKNEEGIQYPDPSQVRYPEMYKSTNNTSPTSEVKLPDPETIKEFQNGLINHFPVLSQCAHLSEDGTLNITCNVGANKGQVYSVNQNEGAYDVDRVRFQQFVDSLPGIENLKLPDDYNKGGET